MRRILTPREHGTYAQLTFPLLSGLMVGGPTLAGIGLALSVACVFLAYEPAVVLLGVRGVRLQRQRSATARRQLAGVVPAALLLAAAAVLRAPPPARLLVLVPATCALLLVPLLPARRIKTLAGEALTAAALAGMHLPIAAAGGATGVALWGPALVWFVAFVLAILAVHAIKARHKQRDPWLGPVAAWTTIAVGIAVAGLLAAVPSLRPPALALALPLSAILVVNLARLHPRSLKRVGWVLVASDVAALALLALL